MKPHKNISQKGFGLIEIIVAVGIFAIIAISGGINVLESFSTDRLGDEYTEATYFAAEGLEATRSIRNQAWANLTTGAHGLNTPASGTPWAFSGISNVVDSKFTRVTTVSPVNRDASGNIVSSGGTTDPDTLKATSVVTWNFTPSRLNTITLTSYLTQWKKSTSTNWGAPVKGACVDIQGANQGLKVQFQGNYAYVIRVGGNPNFAIIDLTNLSAPVIVGSLNISGASSNIAVSGNFAYIASSDNAQEMQVVNISVPSAPVLVGAYNAAGNADGRGILVAGNAAYLVRANSSDPEFFVLNITVPAVPTLTGSLNLSGTGNEVFVTGNYAYIASSENTQDLQVVNITTPALPAVGTHLNLGGNEDAVTVTGTGTTLAVGKTDGLMYLINIISSGAPSLYGSFNAGGVVNDISIGNSNTQAFLGTDTNSSEFRVVNISNPSSPTSAGVLGFSSQDLNGVTVDDARQRAYVAGDNNSEEFCIVSP